jgi:polyhydroxybutyrate depolymerase
MLVSLLIFIGVGIYASNIGLGFFKSGGQTSTQQPSVTCTTPKHDAGSSDSSITSDGLKRTFRVHLAPSYGKQPQPLVINYHGYNVTAPNMERYTGMDTEADKAGFVLVYPQGVDSPPTWNAGVGAYGPTGDADDIQFTRDLLSFLAKNYCVDMHHVYVTGLSLGGGMAYRVACTLSDQITAVATVSGAYYPIPGGCQPSRPMPVLEIHGAADGLAPYNGNPGLRMAAVQDYLNGWLARDKCAGTSQTFFQKGDVTAVEWTHCAGGAIIQHYRVSDGGHTWFGIPKTTQVIDSNVVIWEFFSKF